MGHSGVSWPAAPSPSRRRVANSTPPSARQKYWKLRPCSVNPQLTEWTFVDHGWHGTFNHAILAQARVSAKPAASGATKLQGNSEPARYTF